MNLGVGEILSLRGHHWLACISPTAGGRLLRLDWLGGKVPLPILVSFPDLTNFDPYRWPKAGGFAMLPFSNRLDNGRFRWRDREVKLPTMPGASHALHGVAHRKVWQLKASTRESVQLSYRHRQGDEGWPWSFEATLDFRLSDANFEVRLSFVNTATETAPVGLGWHPYHVRPHGVGLERRLLQLKARAAFDTSPEAATLDGTGSTERPIRSIRLDAPGLGPQTTTFEDWQGHALVSLDNETDVCIECAGAAHLLLHVPTDSSLTCIEPISLLPGALNHYPAPQRETRIGLASGDTRELIWRCRVQTGEA